MERLTPGSLELGVAVSSERANGQPCSQAAGRRSSAADRQREPVHVGSHSSSGSLVSVAFQASQGQTLCITPLPCLSVGRVPFLWLRLLCLQSGGQPWYAWSPASPPAAGHRHSGLSTICCTPCCMRFTSEQLGYDPRWSQMGFVPQLGVQSAQGRSRRCTCSGTRFLDCRGMTLRLAVAPPAELMTWGVSPAGQYRCCWIRHGHPAVSLGGVR